MKCQNIWIETTGCFFVWSNPIARCKVLTITFTYFGRDFAILKHFLGGTSKKSILYIHTIHTIPPLRSPEVGEQLKPFQAFNMILKVKVIPQ